MTPNDVRPAKPVPVVAPWARPFWDAAREGRLILQHCEDCDRVIHYPRMVCPHCSSTKLDWRAASGRGTIYSFTVVQSNAPSAFAGDVPYVVAVIRLAEGVQMLSNIVECDHDELFCDQEVEVVFEHLDEEFTLPKFRPVR
ncbi:MAG: Zn-ribbon domain-containing OB-fold protein [Acidimicrobiaceae bacterium]|nr:Zn-ribbon domain-containing OB-fold protein [Acidimicrobiaceae bacterium]